MTRFPLMHGRRPASHQKLVVVHVDGAESIFFLDGQVQRETDMDIVLTPDWCVLKVVVRKKGVAEYAISPAEVIDCDESEVKINWAGREPRLVDEPVFS